MSLDFTDVPDRQGSAVYMLYDGTMTQQRLLEHLKKNLETLAPERQIVLVSVKDRNGEHIRDFYDLTHESLPYVLIIRDNDELAQTWSGPNVPTAEYVAYALRAEAA